MENNEEDHMPIRAALITMPPDDPAQVANLGRVLHGGTDFKLAMLEYKPWSAFSPGFRDPITGLSMTGFTEDRFIRYGQAKIQVHCKQIRTYLEDVLSKDTRVEFNYISGRPYKVVNSLKSMFDLFIVPRPFSLPNIGHSIFADLNLRLVQAGEIPILFWAKPEKWQHIIIVKAPKDRDYGEIPVKNYLLNLTENLDVGVFEGNKILEIRKVGVNKGRAAEFWTAKQNWDFLLAAGDDYTDEEMFGVLPDRAYSIKVGISISKARFSVDTPNEIMSLLKELVGN